MERGLNERKKLGWKKAHHDEKKKGKLEDKKRENEKIKKKERIRARKKDVSEFRLRGDTFLSKMAF